MKRIIFWCEFPERVNLNKLDYILKKLNLNIDVYIASNSLKEFNNFKEIFSRIKQIKTIGYWPILDKNKGYWYSGFTDESSIKDLLKLKGVKLKIDIEPPIEGNRFSYFKMFFWIAKYCLFKKSKNKDKLSEVFYKLNKENLIISTFPLHRFMLSNLININVFKNSNLNLMHYSSLMPKVLRPFYNVYFRFIFESYRKVAKNVFVAVGLISKGVFGNEPIYKDLKEFKRDLEFVKKLKIDSIVVFELSGILKRENYEEWFKALELYKL